MSGVAKKLMSASGGVAGFTAIEDVFSTHLYVGNQTARTITNGIDLAGEGGLTWITPRTVAAEHQFIDSERGVSPTSTPILISSLTNGQINRSGAVTAYNSDGFDLGTYDATNYTGRDMVSWTFRKAPRFFDVVTYTGNGVARTISHNLGTTVGSIIIKRTDTTSNWAVYHRGNTAAPETDFLSLNLTNATADDATYWNDTAPTDSVFTVGTNAAVNASGGTYVAYLYAHDPLGPSGDGSDGLIACGSFTGNGDVNGNPGQEVELGFEPQWILSKRSNGDEDWNIRDVMRGATTDGTTQRLRPNSSAAESENSGIVPYSLGFKAFGGDNLTGATYIYIAIRRGPMRAPTSGTEVFAMDTAHSDGDNTVTGDMFTAGFPVDMGIYKQRAVDGFPFVNSARLVGERALYTNSTEQEGPYSDATWDHQSGWFSGSTAISTDRFSWMFRRAPEFFDVVAYAGNGVSLREVSHNLKVSPELLVIKNRSITTDWFVDFYPDETQRLSLRLNLTNAASGPFTSLLPTPSTIILGNTSLQNQSGNNYIAYLFSTLAGISKVGSYTGNGTSQTINCGFTSSARFILIKRTDSTGDWYVWDTARGIVAANDPHLSLNTTAAEVTTDDSVDPVSSGFIVNQVAATNINVSAASYIFYAVA